MCVRNCQCVQGCLKARVNKLVLNLQYEAWGLCKHVHKKQEIVQVLIERFSHAWASRNFPNDIC